jgi:uncharacterized protein
MPAALSYPGVYIEELSSGVRTITGVATSITAFIGRAARGPTEEPVVITSYGDFERQFGGLGVNYPLSYAVRDFYLNGGAKAIIVRLFNSSFASEQDESSARKAAEDTAAAAVGVDANAAADAAKNKADTSFPNEPQKSPAQTVAKAAKDAATPGATVADVQKAATAAVNAAVPLSRASLSIEGITLQAKNPGSWGQQLSATVERKNKPEINAMLGIAVGDAVLNLTVKYGSSTETFMNLTVVESARRIDRVLKAESNLVAWKGAEPSSAIAVPTNSKSDTVTEAKANAKAKAAALKAAEEKTPPDPAEIAAAKTARDTANAALQSAVNALGGVDSRALNAINYMGSRGNKTGLYALEKADLFNLLCIPGGRLDGDVPNAVYAEAMSYCAERRAILLVDPPSAWTTNPETAVSAARDGLEALGLSGPFARNAALYFPRIMESDPLRDGQNETFVPCGLVAGIIARTDTTRGVWKAPAGLDAAMVGISGVDVRMTDLENGILNPLGINCLRAFPVNGRVIWGARTMRGADQLADEYKYLPVRRTALFIEESLYRGTQWVVFEPNDEPLWAQVRLNIGAFMNTLFRQGAFQGKTPAEAYFVKCDKETTNQNDINLGIVNIVVGFAPLKPAEFVVIKLQQIAGQVQA